VDSVLGGSAAVTDIETIDADAPEFTPVVEAFNRYGIWALPVVTLDGKVVSVGITAPEQISATLRQEMNGSPETAEENTVKKIEIFDPAMCCSTGVCGPSIDPELMRVAATISALKEKGFVIQRYGLSTDTQQFVSNKVINDLLQQQGAAVLPVTLADGQVVKTQSYPTGEEFAAWSGISVNAEVLNNEGCCDEGPKGCCSGG